MGWKPLWPYHQVIWEDHSTYCRYDQKLLSNTVPRCVSFSFELKKKCVTLVIVCHHRRVNCTNCIPPLWFLEHQYGVREGHGGHGVHLHRSPPPLRYSQHPRLVPQQRLHHSIQAYPTQRLSSRIIRSRSFALQSSVYTVHVPCKIQAFFQSY